MPDGVPPGSQDGLGPQLHTVRAVLVPSNVWRVGLTLAAVLALVMFARFALADGG